MSDLAARFIYSPLLSTPFKVVCLHCRTVRPASRLEQISLASNREDSQRFINERVCRH